MATVLTDSANYTAIANAIRGKNGSSGTYLPSEMAAAITAIPTGGGSAVVQALSVTQNGTYSPPTGVDGYAPVTVNVSGGGDSLPSGYTEVEYIGVSNGGYATLQSNIEAGDVIKASVAYISGGPTYKGFLYVGKQSTTYYYSEHYFSNGLPYMYASSSGDAIHKTSDPSVSSTNKQETAYQSSYTAGDRLDYSVTVDSMSAYSPQFIEFGRYSQSAYLGIGRLYGLTIEKPNGRKSVDMVPCVRGSDSAAGFYELRSNKFMTHSDFVAGPAVS